MLLTACDDMHTHLYDVEHATLIEAFSGEHLRGQTNFKALPCRSCLSGAVDVWYVPVKRLFGWQVMNPGCSVWLVTLPAAHLQQDPAMPESSCGICKLVPVHKLLQSMATR
jgi:hypothetical protein